jgi:hypothetical protein
VPGTKNVTQPTLIDPQKLCYPFTHKTRDNEQICQSFGQKWPLLSVPQAEVSIAVLGKSEGGFFDGSQIRKLIRDFTLPSP